MLKKYWKFKSRVNRIDSSYKMIKFLSGKGISADVGTLEFSFGAVVLINKLVFKVGYEKIGVAGSHFGTP